MTDDSTDELTVGLAQIEVEPAAVPNNVERALAAIETAAMRGVDLVALPELFTVGFFAFDAYARAAEPLDGPVLRRVADAASDHGIAVLAGSIVEDLAASAGAGFDVPETDGFANTAVLFTADGSRSLVYRKRHLFGYDSREADLLVPGESVETAAVGPFTVGVTTCYDLRFPELYRELVDAGTDLFVVPSAWPSPRVEHWELFGRARAVENQAYLAAVNGVGSFDDADLLGRSTVYDPWGPTLAGASDDPTLVTATLDPERVKTVREEFPSLDDRRS